MSAKVKGAVVAAVTVLVVACGGEPEVAEKKLRPVRYMEVNWLDTSQEVSFAGVARSGIESRLSFRVGGTIDTVRAQVGDRVQRGEVLARLDPTDYRLAVEEAEAAEAQSIAAARRAQADYDRARALYENNNVAKSDLDAARAAAESAEAQVDAAHKRLERARQQLQYTRLAAPLAGSVAEVSVEVNESVQAGQAVFLLTSGARPEVKVALAEGLISGVERGQAATVRFDAIPGTDYTAAVTEVGVAASGSTTFEVTVQLDEPAEEVRSGMAAEVRLQLAGEVGEQALFLPPIAVGEDAQGKFVYVVEVAGEGAGVVRRRAVTVGALGEQGIEVAGGLAAGELVATAGVRRLADGMEVRMLDDGEGEG